MKIETVNNPIETFLPHHIQSLLKSCPTAGSGVHKWVICLAVRLHRYFADQSDIADLLRKYSANCGRDVDETEIWDAITSSEQWLARQKGKAMELRATPHWPSRNEEQIAAITEAGPNLVELEASSPVRWIDGEAHTEQIFDSLFPDQPLLCASTKKETALTRPREEWRGFMANQQFIVPSPMSAPNGKTKAGRVSMRTLANTGPRRFLVIEFDQGTFDQHAALLVHLSKFAPLVLVVHSGNKSLHGWFACKNASDDEVQNFFRYAVSLGADPATWTPCQWVRMPDGKRDNGQRQRVIYFNPKSLEET